MLPRNLEEREQALTVFFLCPPAHPPPVFRGGAHDSQLPRDRSRRSAERTARSRSHRGPVSRGHVHVASPAHTRRPPAATRQHVRPVKGVRSGVTRARSCRCGPCGVKRLRVCPSVRWKDSAMNFCIILLVEWPYRSSPALWPGRSGTT